MNPYKHTGVFLATFAFCGCASVLETTPVIGSYVHLDIGRVFGPDEPSVQIVQITRAGDTDGPYVPSGKGGLLWLRSGQYTTKLKCNRPSHDKGPFIILPSNNTPLPPDGSFSFKIEYTHDTTYGLDCWTSETGQVFILFGPAVEVTGG